MRFDSNSLYDRYIVVECNFLQMIDLCLPEKIRLKIKHDSSIKKCILLCSKCSINKIAFAFVSSNNKNG